MNDIEDRLRRFRPAAPPIDLRARVLADAAGRRRSTIWEWLPAGAAAAVALAFYALSAAASVHTAAHFQAAARERAAGVADLAIQLGGGPLATIQAERSIEMNGAVVADSDPATAFDDSRGAHHD